jgi:hypothetical protein
MRLVVASASWRAFDYGSMLTRPPAFALMENELVTLWQELFALTPALSPKDREGLVLACWLPGARPASTAHCELMAASKRTLGYSLGGSWAYSRYLCAT